MPVCAEVVDRDIDDEVGTLLTVILTGGVEVTCEPLESVTSSKTEYVPAEEKVNVL